MGQVGRRVLGAALVGLVLLTSGCATARTAPTPSGPASALVEPAEDARTACLDSASHSVSLKPLGKAAGLGLMSGVVLAARGAAEGAWIGFLSGGESGKGAWIGAAVGAGLGLTVGIVLGVKEGVDIHRTYTGAYERCLSEKTAALAEPYPTQDIDEVKPTP